MEYTDNILKIYWNILHDSILENTDIILEYTGSILIVYWNILIVYWSLLNYCYLPLDIECSGLRVKTFGSPDPFLKIKVVPGPRLPKLPYHAHQLVVTPVVFGSTSPSWSDEVGVA